MKFISDQVSVTTPSTVHSARRVRAYATANTLVTVTTVQDSGNTEFTFTMGGGSTEYIIKKSIDTVSANVALLCNSVAYGTG